MRVSRRASVAVLVVAIDTLHRVGILRQVPSVPAASVAGCAFPRTCAPKPAPARADRVCRHRLPRYRSLYAVAGLFELAPDWAGPASGWTVQPSRWTATGRPPRTGHTAVCTFPRAGATGGAARCFECRQLAGHAAPFSTTSAQRDRAPGREQADSGLLDRTSNQLDRPPTNAAPKRHRPAPRQHGNDAEHQHQAQFEGAPKTCAW